MWRTAGLFGLSVGNLLMTQPLWLAEIYPPQIYARVFARANAISVTGVAMGPYGMGLIFDAFGGKTYTQPYLVGVTLSAAALAIVFFTSHPSRIKTFRDVTAEKTEAR